MHDAPAYIDYNSVSETEALFVRGALTSVQYDAALTYGARYKQAQKGKTDLADEYGVLSFLETALIDRVVGQGATLDDFIRDFDVSDFDYEAVLAVLRSGLNKLVELYEV